MFDICRLCADMTANCPTLSSDWVSILKVVTVSNKITGPKQPFEYGHADFIKMIDVSRFVKGFSNTIMQYWLFCSVND